MAKCKVCSTTKGTITNGYCAKCKPGSRSEDNKTAGKDGKDQGKKFQHHTSLNQFKNSGGGKGGTGGR